MRRASGRHSPITRCLRSRQSCSSQPPSRAWSSAPRRSAGKLSASSITSSDARVRTPCRVFSRERVNDETGILATVIGSVAFVVAATGAFLELQAALNTIWRVKPNPGVNLKAFLMDRLRSFGLVVAIGFLLMVSLAVTAALAAFSGWLVRALLERPAGVERSQRARIAHRDDGAVRPPLSRPA